MMFQMHDLTRLLLLFHTPALICHECCPVLPKCTAWRWFPIS